MSKTLCRLYLVLAPGTATCPSREDISRILAAGDIACILLRCSGDRQSHIEQARAITALVQTSDTAVLVENDPELANEIHADGVHLTGAIEEYDTARQLLPEDAIVGIDAYGSRHRAMQAGERGADYVAIDATEEEIVGWWTDIFQVPCVAITDGDSAMMRRAVEQSAEFIAIDTTRWSDIETGIAQIAAATALIKDIDRELAR